MDYEIRNEYMLGIEGSYGWNVVVLNLEGCLLVCCGDGKHWQILVDGGGVCCCWLALVCGNTAVNVGWCWLMLHLRM